MYWALTWRSLHWWSGQEGFCSETQGGQNSWWISVYLEGLVQEHQHWSCENKRKCLQKGQKRKTFSFWTTSGNLWVCPISHCLARGTHNFIFCREIIESGDTFNNWGAKTILVFLRFCWETKEWNHNCRKLWTLRLKETLLWIEWHLLDSDGSNISYWGYYIFT